MRRIVLFVVLGLVFLTSGSAEASHAMWRDGNIVHWRNAALFPPKLALFGDSMGYGTSPLRAALWRSAFQGAVTNQTNETWAWPLNVDAATVAPNSSQCLASRPINQWRTDGVTEVCIADYDLGTPSTLGVYEFNWTTGGGQSHFYRARIRVNDTWFSDAEINNIGRAVICQEAGHSLGLAHSPDTDSCMQNPLPLNPPAYRPNLHDHQYVENIYAYHGG